MQKFTHSSRSIFQVANDAGGIFGRIAGQSGQLARGEPKTLIHRGIREE